MSNKVLYKKKMRACVSVCVCVAEELIYWSLLTIERIFKCPFEFYKNLFGIATRSNFFKRGQKAKLKI